ncbi:MAG: phosphoribosylformylglycinamidine cyclo-ligase [Solirubrobacteraceae bacterium]|nr:phosphoribosylformylglycinamidine cyclo-ligase [Solirubrobacteraceae bacterium]
MSQEGASYRAAGVDYETLDAGKRLALSSALATSPLLERRGGRALDASRGEPAFVFELGGRTLAFVVEGLGTKAMIARAVLEAGGANRFADVAYDTVAAIANDLCCVGALPLVVNAYFATGSSDWYLRGDRSRALVEGWQRGCLDAGATWGGGESPSLPGLLAEDEVELAGAAVGAVPEGRSAILGEELAPGDEIVLGSSSGLHANGASLARLIAQRLPGGYATELPDGTSLGEALLEPTVMYVPLVAALLEQALPVTYLSHVTGHGLLKLMRPQRELTYRIERLPPVPPVLEFLVEQAGLDARTAYTTFNMGSGFAVYCAAGAGERVVGAAATLGIDAIVAGVVEEGPRRVVVEPVGVSFEGAEMELSAPDEPSG